MKENNPVLEKSFQFSLEVIKLYVTHVEQKEYILSKQFLRSGTSIGAMAEEAQGAHSKKDFIAKFEIGYKEARETLYWFRLLQVSQLIKNDYTNIINQVRELIKIITSILNSSKDL